MNTRIMYLERKDDRVNGPARIGRVTDAVDYFRMAGGLEVLKVKE